MTSFDQVHGILSAALVQGAGSIRKEGIQRRDCEIGSLEMQEFSCRRAAARRQGLGAEAASGPRSRNIPIAIRSLQMCQIGDYRILREIGRGGMGVVE